MKLGLFDLFDQMVAEELGVDVETYIKTIESDNVSDEEQKEIIMGMVGDNVEVGVYALKDALAIAEELELDLVEISPNAVPPVCKVVDYNKFLYEQKKKMKEDIEQKREAVFKAQQSFNGKA